MVISKAKNEQKKSKVKQTRNRRYETLVKNHLKNLRKKIGEKNVDFLEIQRLFNDTQKFLDRAARRKIIHRNKAARHKSQLSKKINELEKKVSSSVVPE